MRAPAMTALALAAAVFGAAGCTQATSTSSEDFKGREKQVADAIHELSTAARRADARKICDTYLTADLKRRLTALARTSKRGTDCADQVRDSIRDADAFDLEVKSVRVTGNTATAQVETTTNADRDPTDTVQLVDQRGWRLAELP